MIATKFAQDIDPDTHQPRGRMLTPDQIAGAVDGSLRRLGLETIDLYHQHRVNPDVPLEEMAGAVKNLVDAGKARQFRRRIDGHHRWPGGVVHRRRPHRRRHNQLRSLTWAARCRRVCVARRRVCGSHDVAGS
jgi:hypothetical protein